MSSGSSPEEYSLEFEERFIHTSDGALVHTWLMFQKESLQAPTVVYFHGNAGEAVCDVISTFGLTEGCEGGRDPRGVFGAL
jgi:predicted alpha/beta-fold hydrolase